VISEYGNEKENVHLPMFLEKTWNLPWCMDLESWLPLLMTDQLYKSFWLKSLTKLAHPPDFGPYDFWLLPKLKVALNSHRFSNTVGIQEHAMAMPNNIPQQRFQQHFEQWEHRLTNRLQHHGTNLKVTGTISV